MGEYGIPSDGLQLSDLLRAAKALAEYDLYVCSATSPVQVPSLEKRVLVKMLTGKSANRTPSPDSKHTLPKSCN
jgi:hypothetical protein